MKRLDFRTVLGAGLMVLGGLLLLERMNIIRGASGIFWGLTFLAGAAYFFYAFAQDSRRRWWAVIPAMTLLGLGVDSLLPRGFTGWAGAVLLGALGVSFFVIYINNRINWWAIIPGGVLLTLAVVSTLTTRESFNAINSGSLFFIGLGFTFLLVAILPNPVGKMPWAYIPAVVLILMGVLLASQATAGLVAYVWPAALIIAGLLVLGSFFWNRD